jgi:hypothetical protein
VARTRKRQCAPLRTELSNPRNDAFEAVATQVVSYRATIRASEHADACREHLAILDTRAGRVVRSGRRVSMMVVVSGVSSMGLALEITVEVHVRLRAKSARGAALDATDTALIARCAWPYAAQIASSTSADLGLPPLAMAMPGDADP